MTAVAAARKWWNYLKWRLNGSPVDTGIPSAAEWADRVGAVAPSGAPHRLISVVVLDTVPAAAFASVAAQTHGNWELLVPADASAGSLDSDSRLVRIPESPPDRFAARAIAAARGDLVVLLYPDAALTRHALGWLAAAPAEVDLVYGDHVLLRRGRPVALRLKPAWSPRLLGDLNYVGAAFAVATARLRRLADSSPVALSAAGELLRALSAAPLSVAHLPVPLATARFRSEPPVAALLHRNDTGPARRPRVKVVIPTRDRVDLLAQAVAGVRRATGVEVALVVVDNGSIDPATHRYLETLGADGAATVLRIDAPFNFSRLINRGARTGPDADHLLMLNNDIAMSDDAWLAGLCRWLEDPGVVGAGPKLLFPDGRIQHAGMVLGLGGIAGHYSLGEERVPAQGPPDRPREVSCLTGACLLVRLADFEAVGGLDEDLAVDHQDVDFCLRLRRQRGGDLVYDPTHPLTHIQMASRDPGAAGSEDTIARMRMKWGAVLDEPDPFWNPHLSLMSPGKDLAMLPSDPDVLRSRLAPRVRVSLGVA